jgi:hypothetical protein
MPESILTKIPVLLLALCLSTDAGAQRLFFNTPTDVYEILGSPGNFTYKDLGHFCVPDNQSVFSLAVHADTLYILTSKPALYQVILSTGSCRLLPFSGAGANNLTCDNNGSLYYLSGDLYKYDPHTNTTSDLGRAPVSPDGDLLWYNGMLICAGNGSALWAIDPDDPTASFKLMDTGIYDFIGLLELPDNCRKNRLFGIDGGNPANIAEIDPTTWTMGNVAGQIPNYIYDAASLAEDGTFSGVVFDSLALLAPCGQATSGSLQAFSSSAGDGSTTYTLDGTTTNTTGLFPNVIPGTHTIHIEASPGCIVDSTFTMDQGLSTVTWQIAAPVDCTQPTDGNIQVTATSGELPILYSLNANGFQPGAAFYQLDTGTYILKIVDAGHCEKDTTIILSYQHNIPFPATITTEPALCVKANGSLTLRLNSGVDPGSFAATIDKAPMQPSIPLTDLPAGTDNLPMSVTNSATPTMGISVFPSPARHLLMSPA